MPSVLLIDGALNSLACSMYSANVRNASSSVCGIASGLRSVDHHEAGGDQFVLRRLPASIAPSLDLVALAPAQVGAGIVAIADHLCGIAHFLGCQLDRGDVGIAPVAALAG